MSLEVSLAPGSAETLARQVARALRQAIVALRLRPGAMLSEQEVASSLGVSRQPVREAFIKLHEAGLLDVLPQRGTRVVKLSPGAAADALFVREAVEGAVAREAARRATPLQVAALFDNLALQRKAARAEDAVAFFALDEAFHAALAQAAQRPSAWRIVEEVKPQMDRVRALEGAAATPVYALIRQHAAIAAAVKDGDGAAAKKAMRAHLAEALRRLPELVALHPDCFEPDPGPD